jgi:hypothetical protein
MVEGWMRHGLNRIDKQDFLAIYPAARTESQSVNNIFSAFRATGILPFDPDQVLSRLHMSFRTLSPPPRASSPYTAATPYDIKQLQQQTDILQHIVVRRHGSSPSRGIIHVTHREGTTTTA